MRLIEKPVPQISDIAISTNAACGLSQARVLLCGLGNIGSYLAVLLAPLVSFMRLVDRDTVEPHNTLNQFYEPQHVGQNKVDVTADRIERLAPQLKVERRVTDIEDLPWGEFADVNFAVAALDSLRARQILSQNLYPLRKLYIDGAVGDPLLVRTQVLMPDQACLECNWGPAQYRQLTTEYPCFPGASAEAARTTAPGCAGAATAAAMVAQCMRLFAADPPPESYEINGDLLAGRLITSRRRRNEQCRFGHEVVSQLIRLETPLAKATIANLLAAVQRNFGQQAVHLEFRRGIIEDDLFGASRFASPEQLARISHRRLDEIGLTPNDRVAVRASGQSRLAHVCFDSSYGAGHE